MRIAKIPGPVVVEKVMESLLRRMNPETRMVIPSFKTLMREVGVCRQRIADAVRILKDRGRIVAIDVPHVVNGRKIVDVYYEIKECQIVHELC